MKECCDEGALRAYLDRELASEEMARMAAHLGACAECHARYNAIAGRAARVSEWMDALVVPSAAVAAAQVVAMPRRSMWPRAAVVLALAAAAALAFVALPKRGEAPKPVAAPHVRPVRPVAEQALAPKVEPPALSRPGAAGKKKRAKAPDVEYYLALDDEPIDSGTVMRVDLDGTGIQADVIFDAGGRPRAIRTVK